eukprot:1285778-Rhodomonas_salina.2
METPCAQLDFAKEDGTVVGLGDEEGLKEVASEKLEERTEYILVKREIVVGCGFPVESARGVESASGGSRLRVV